MDFQLKEKLSRLDEERQRKRAQRAEEAVRRLEDLGKQTLAMIEQAKPEQQLERLRNDQKVNKPKEKIGRLSRVLFETATRIDVTNPAFDPEYGDRRPVHTIGKALPRPQREIENRAKRTLGHIDTAMAQIQGAVMQVGGAGIVGGLTNATKAVESAMSSVTSTATAAGVQVNIPPALRDLHALDMDDEREEQVAADRDRDDTEKETAAEHEEGHKHKHGLGKILGGLGGLGGGSMPHIDIPQASGLIDRATGAIDHGVGQIQGIVAQARSAPDNLLDRGLGQIQSGVDTILRRPELNGSVLGGVIDGAMGGDLTNLPGVRGINDRIGAATDGMIVGITDHPGTRGLNAVRDALDFGRGGLDDVKHGALETAGTTIAEALGGHRGVTASAITGPVNQVLQSVATGNPLGHEATHVVQQTTGRVMEQVGAALGHDRLAGVQDKVDRVVDRGMGLLDRGVDAITSPRDPTSGLPTGKRRNDDPINTPATAPTTPGKDGAPAPGTAPTAAAGHKDAPAPGTAPAGPAHKDPVGAAKDLGHAALDAIKGKGHTDANHGAPHEVTSPRDPASGMATGKRSHKPLAATAPVPASGASIDSIVNNAPRAGRPDAFSSAPNANATRTPDPTRLAASTSSASRPDGGTKARVGTGSSGGAKLDVQPVVSPAPQVDRNAQQITQPGFSINARGESGAVPQVPADVTAPVAPNIPAAPQINPAAPQIPTTATPTRNTQVQPLSAPVVTPRPTNPAIEGGRGAAQSVSIPTPSTARAPAVAGTAAPAAVAPSAQRPQPAGAAAISPTTTPPPAPPAPAMPTAPSTAPQGAAPAQTTGQLAPAAPTVPAVRNPGGDKPPDPAGLVPSTVSLSNDRNAASASLRAEAATADRVGPEASAQRQSNISPLAPELTRTGQSAEGPRQAAAQTALASSTAATQQGTAGVTANAQQGQQQITSQGSAAAQQRAQIAGQPPPAVIAETAPSKMAPAAAQAAAAVAGVAGSVAGAAVEISGEALSRAHQVAATNAQLPPFPADKFAPIDQKPEMPPLDLAAVQSGTDAATAQFTAAKTAGQQIANIPAPQFPQVGGGDAGGKTPTGQRTRDAAIAQIEQQVSAQGQSQSAALAQQGAAHFSGEIDKTVTTAQTAGQSKVTDQLNRAQADAQSLAQTPPPITAAQASAQAQSQFQQYQDEATTAQASMQGEITTAQGAAQSGVQTARGQRTADVAAAQSQYRATVDGQLMPGYATEQQSAHQAFDAGNRAAQTAHTQEQQAAQQDAQRQTSDAQQKAQADITAQRAQLDSQRQAAQSEHEAQIRAANQQAMSDRQRAEQDMDSQVQQQQAQMRTEVARQQSEGQRQVEQHLATGERQYQEQIQQGQSQAEGEKRRAESEAAAKKAQADEEKKKHDGGVFGAVVGWVKDRINDLLDAAASLLKAACDLVVSIMEKARQAAMAALNAARQAALAALNSVKNAIQGVISAVASRIRSIISAAASLIRGVIQTLASALQQIVRALTTVLTSLVQAFQSAVNGLLDGLISVVGLINKDLANKLQSATQKYRDAFNKAMDGLQDGIRSAGQRLEHGIQQAADAAISAVDRAEQALNAAVTRVETALNNAVEAAYQKGVGIINRAFDMAEAAVNAVFDVAEAAVKAYFDMYIGALHLVQQGVNMVADFYIALADKVLGAISDIAAAIIDLIPEGVTKWFVDFWNGPWRSVIIIGLATIAAVAITGATLGFGAPIAAMLLAGVIGGTIAGTAYFGGEVLAREGQIDLTENHPDQGMYVPGHGYVKIGPDGKPIPPAGMKPEELEDFNKQFQWSASNFNMQKDPTTGQVTGYQRKEGSEIADYAVQEGIKGFGEGFIASAAAAGGAAFGAQAGAAAWLTRINNPVTRQLVGKAMSAAVEGGFNVAQNGMTQAWTQGFDAYQEGGDLSKAFGKAWEAGINGVTDPSQITAALLNVGVAPAKAKWLEPLLESKVGNQLVRSGLQVGGDMATDLVGQSGGAFVATYADAIKNNESPSDAFKKALSAGGDAFKPENVAMSAFMNTAGQVANKGAEKAFGHGGADVSGARHPATDEPGAPTSKVHADEGGPTVVNDGKHTTLDAPTEPTIVNDGKHTTLDGPTRPTVVNDGKGTSIEPTRTTRPDVDADGNTRANKPGVSEDPNAPSKSRVDDPNRHVETDADAQARRIQDAEAETQRQRGETEIEARKRREETEAAAEADKPRRDAIAKQLDGDTGHAGIEVHSHFLGNVEPDVIRLQLDKAGIPKHPGDTPYEPLLRSIGELGEGSGWNHRYDDPSDPTKVTKRRATGDAMARVEQAQQKIAELRSKLDTETNPTERQKLRQQIDEEARTAVDKALRASDETDFNSSYEIRDELIKRHYANTEADAAGRPIDPALAKAGLSKDAPSTELFAAYKEHFKDQNRPDLMKKLEAAETRARQIETELEGVDTSTKAGRNKKKALEAELAEKRRMGSEQIAYDNYTRDTVLRLAADGIQYTEQSNSLKKMGQRFDQEQIAEVKRQIAGMTDEQLREQFPNLEPSKLRANVDDLEVKFLTMTNTANFGSRDRVTDDTVFRDRVSLGGKKGFREEVESLKKMVRERGDTVGIDIAGAEHFAFDKVGAKRFEYLYSQLVKEAQLHPGEPIVLRPHVGEGANDVVDGQLGRRDSRRQTTSEGELTHIERAKKNIDALIDALEHAGHTPESPVIVRFGHATHTTPEQAARMKKLGIVVEVNLGSNIETGALDQHGGSKPGQRRNDDVEPRKINDPKPAENFDEHALTTLIMNDVPVVLSTDAHAVMSTSMGDEYRRAHKIIEEVISGQREVPITVDQARAHGIEIPDGAKTATIKFSDMTPAEQQRFLDGYQKLHQDAQDYYARRPKPDRVDRPASTTDPDTGTASAIPGSLFQGNARDPNPTLIQHHVESSTQGAIDLVPRTSSGVPGMELGPRPGTVVIEGANKAKHEVAITTRDFGPDDTSVAKFDLKTRPITVEVSARARPEDVQRALAHELTEVRQRLAGGTYGDKADAEGLTPHDHGRLAEKRVLEAQAEQARQVLTDGKASATDKQNAQTRLASLEGEIGAIDRDIETRRKQQVADPSQRPIDAGPVPDHQAHSAERLKGMVDTIHERYQDQLPPHATEMVGPPPEQTGNVLKKGANDALIGLPDGLIKPTANYDEALAALQTGPGIPRWEKLNPKERAHETEFIKQLQADLPRTVDTFIEASKRSGAADGTVIFEVDAAKKMYEPYGSGGKPANDDERAVRATANHALHPAAVAVARLALLKHMETLPPGATIFVTNGGCAAGKGNLTELANRVRGEHSEKFGAVWDAAGEGDARENMWLLQAARERKLKVIYGYAENDPMLTYNSVLARAEASGRIVDPVTFARSYAHGAEEMRNFLNSPEYQAAVKDGSASALGVFAGEYDPKANGGRGGYPNARRLGDNGAITGDDIRTMPDVNKLTDNALNQFDTWMKSPDRKAELKPLWFEGAITNTQKFGDHGIDPGGAGAVHPPTHPAGGAAPQETAGVVPVVPRRAPVEEPTGPATATEPHATTRKPIDDDVAPAAKPAEADKGFMSESHHTLATHPAGPAATVQLLDAAKKFNGFLKRLAKRWFKQEGDEEDEDDKDGAEGAAPAAKPAAPGSVIPIQTGSAIGHELGHGGNGNGNGVVHADGVATPGAGTPAALHAPLAVGTDGGVTSRMGMMADVAAPVRSSLAHVARDIDLLGDGPIMFPADDRLDPRTAASAITSRALDGMPAGQPQLKMPAAGNGHGAVQAKGPAPTAGSAPIASTATAPVRKPAAAPAAVQTKHAPEAGDVTGKHVEPTAPVMPTAATAPQVRAPAAVATAPTAGATTDDAVGAPAPVLTIGETAVATAGPKSAQLKAQLTPTVTATEATHHVASQHVATDGHHAAAAVSTPAVVPTITPPAKTPVAAKTPASHPTTTPTPAAAPAATKTPVAETTAHDDPAHGVDPQHLLPATAPVTTAAVATSTPAGPTTAAAPTGRPRTLDTEPLGDSDASFAQREQTARDRIQTAAQRGDAQQEVARQQQAIDQHQQHETGATQQKGQQVAADQAAARQHAQQRAAHAQQGAHQHGQQRQQSAQQQQKVTVESLKKQFEDYAKSRVGELDKLKDTLSKQLDDNLKKLADAQVKAADDEEKKAEATFKAEQDKLAKEIAKGKADAETTRQTKERELVKINTDGKAKAKSEETKAIAEAQKAGTAGAAALRKTGHDEAHKIQVDAQHAAASLRAEGQHAAQAARQKALAGKTPEEKEKAQSAASAAAAHAKAEYESQAKAKLAEAATQAKTVSDQYEQQAKEFLERTKQAIETQKQTTLATIAQLDADLEQGKGKLVTERDTAIHELDAQMTALNERAQKELDQQKAAHAALKEKAEEDRKRALQQGLIDIANDYDKNKAEVEKNVTAKLAETRGKLATATNKDLEQIQKDVQDSVKAIEGELGKITKKSDERVAAYQGQVIGAIQKIQARGETARQAITKLGETATKAAAHVSAVQAQKMDNVVAQNQARSDRRIQHLQDDLNWQTLNAQYGDDAEGKAFRAKHDQDVKWRELDDRTRDGVYDVVADNLDNRRKNGVTDLYKEQDAANATRYQQENDEAYRQKQAAQKPERPMMSPQQAEEIAVKLKGTQGWLWNSSGDMFKLLADKTPEELKMIMDKFPGGRDKFLGNLGSGDKAWIEGMLNAQSPAQVKAYAMHWAAEGGITGLGTNREVMDLALGGLQPDERQQLKDAYKTLPMNGDKTSIESMLTSEESPQMAELQTAKLNGDEARVKAMKTVIAAEGGWMRDTVDTLAGWGVIDPQQAAAGRWVAGLGTDEDGYIKARDDIHEKYKGPFASKEEADKAKRDEADELAKVSAIVKEKTGKTLAEMDDGEFDKNKWFGLGGPNATRRALDGSLKQDWTEYNASKAEAGLSDWFGNQQWNDEAFKNSTPEERKAIRERIKTNTGKDYEGFVNDNLYNVAEREAAKQMGLKGEVDDATAIIRAQYGGRFGIGTDTDEIKKRLAGKSKAEIKQLTDEYAAKCKELGLAAPQWLIDAQNGIDGFFERNPYMKYAAMAVPMAWPLLMGSPVPTGDLKTDIASETSGDDYFFINDQMTFGEPQTYAELMDQQKRWYGYTRGNKLITGLQGDEGEIYEAKFKAMEANYAELKKAGLADLSLKDGVSKLQEKWQAGELSEDQLKQYAEMLMKLGDQGESSKAWGQGARDRESSRTDFVAQVGGAVVAVVAAGLVIFFSGGTATPAVIAMVSAAAGGLGTMGIKAVCLGQRYGREAILQDAANTIIDVIAAGLMPPGAAGQWAEKMVLKLGMTPGVAKNLLAEMIIEAGSAGIQDLSKALVDPNTYVGTPQEIMARLRKRVGTAAGQQFVNTGVSTALQLKIDPTHGGSKLTLGQQIATNLAGQTVSQLVDPDLLDKKPGEFLANALPGLIQNVGQTLAETTGRKGVGQDLHGDSHFDPSATSGGPALARRHPGEVTQGGPHPGTHPGQQGGASPMTERITQTADGHHQVQTENPAQWLRNIKREAEANGKKVTFDRAGEVDEHGHTIFTVTVTDPKTGQAAQIKVRGLNGNAPIGDIATPRPITGDGAEDTTTPSPHPKQIGAGDEPIGLLPAPKEKPTALGTPENSGNSSAVPGSEYRGNVNAVADHAGIQKQIEKSLGAVAGEFRDGRVKGNEVAIKVNGEDVKVKVHTGEFGDDAVAKFVKHPDGSYEVQVSAHARPGDVERALAHELTEIYHRERREKLRSEQLSGDALKSGSDEHVLSPDDMGRIAELSVLNKQLEAAKKKGAAGADDVATLRKEIAALENHLGLDAGASTDRQARILSVMDVEADRARRDHRADELDLGTGHSGKEVHSHFLGNVESEVFKNLLGKDGDSWLPTLKAINDLEAPQLRHQRDAQGQLVARGISGEAMQIVRDAMLKIQLLENQAKRHPEQADTHRKRIEQIAEDAVNRALRATEDTDFNSSYEIRDELIKKHFGAAEREQFQQQHGIGGKLDDAALKAYAEHFKDRPEIVARIEKIKTDREALARMPEGEGKDKAAKALKKLEGGLPEQFAYDHYARETLLRLAGDGLDYTEQSNSLAKMSQRFDPEMMDALKRQIAADPSIPQSLKDKVAKLDVRFLTMLNTSDFGAAEKQAPELKNVRRDPQTDADFAKSLGGVIDQVKNRHDVVGVDIAGQEHYMFQAFDAAHPEKNRFYQLAMALIGTGKEVVLRPHVGEGAIDTEEGKKYSRDDHRQTTDGELSHEVRARKNLDNLLTVLEFIAKQNGGKLPPELVVRFGHATHATPAHAKRMKDLGIIAEVNLGSNVETGSVDQAKHGPQPKQERTGDRKKPLENLDDHALVTFLFYDTQTILSTDAHAVMSTTMRDEYKRARRLIEEVMYGERPIRVDPETAKKLGGKVVNDDYGEVYYHQLGDAEKTKLKTAYEKLYGDALKYYDTQRPKDEPPPTDGGGRVVKPKDDDRPPPPPPALTDAGPQRRQDQQQQRDKIDGVVDDIKQHHQLTDEQTRLVGPPENTRVLKRESTDALIGLPLDIVPATESYETALKQAQKDGIPRQEKLSANERKHETAFIEQIETNIGQHVDTFYANSFDKKLDTYVFEVDGAKKLYEAYGASKKPENAEQLAVRATANHGLHAAAVEVTRLAFLKRLDELASLPPGHPNREVFVTNGGCAAGKGNLTDLAKRIRGEDAKFGAVWDAAGEGDAMENGWILAAAQKRGLKVVYGYVENDPMKTYDSVLARAEASGRIVDPVTFARSYARGAENMRKFLESPEYQAALANGQVSALGVFAGKYDAKVDGYPEAYRLGQDGAISSKDIKAMPEEKVLVDNALKQFDTWAAKRTKDGKDNSVWFEGGIINTQKFGGDDDGGGGGGGVRPPRGPDDGGPTADGGGDGRRTTKEDLDRLLKKRSTDDLAAMAQRPDLWGPIATDEGRRIAETLPPPPDGQIRLVDGSLTSSHSQGLTPDASAWLAQRKAERGELTGAPRKVVIDGGGPTGALAALQAYMLGHEVTIVEMRDEATLPILWNNRPQNKLILEMIDPVLAARLFSGRAGDIKFSESVAQDGTRTVKQPHSDESATVTGDPRAIAGDYSTFQTQNKTEVNLYWDRLAELASEEATKAKAEGRPPRLTLLRGYEVTGLPADGDKRSVTVQKVEQKLQKMKPDGTPEVGPDGKPITQPYTPGQDVPKGFKVVREKSGVDLDLGTPDDLLVADGAGSRARKMVGAESRDVGPSAQFIAGYFDGVPLQSSPDADGNRQQGGSRYREDTDQAGQPLRTVAGSGSHLGGTWALPEIDPALKLDDPASIKRYFGRDMSKKEATFEYYRRQVARVLEVDPSIIKPEMFEFGPAPFTLQSHVTGPVADDASNVHLIGDARGNSHFLASLGKVTGTGAHQMALHQYWQAVQMGFDPELARRLLDHRLDAATRVWLKSGLPYLNDPNNPR